MLSKNFFYTRDILNFLNFEKLTFGDKGRLISANNAKLSVYLLITTTFNIEVSRSISRGNIKTLESIMKTSYTLFYRPSYRFDFYYRECFIHACYNGNYGIIDCLNNTGKVRDNDKGAVSAIRASNMALLAYFLCKGLEDMDLYMYKVLIDECAEYGEMKMRDYMFRLLNRYCEGNRIIINTPFYY